jgi:hypothetical protein
MVSAPRAAFAIITFIIIIFVTNVVWTVTTPQVMLWYDTALAFGYYPAAVEMGLKVYQVFPIILLGGSAAYLIINMLSEENDSINEWGAM